MANALLCCLLLTIVRLTLSEDAKSKVVKIDQGLVKGYQSSEGDFFVYYGIPYASAPTGPNKFKVDIKIFYNFHQQIKQYYLACNPSRLLTFDW